MKETKLYAAMAIPVLLFLLSYFQRNAMETDLYTSTATSILDGPDYLEVPDYIYSSEYRMIMEKTYLDLFDSKISDSMQMQMIKWLGHCNQDSISGNCSIDSQAEIECGDKISWGGETFCIEW